MAPHECLQKEEFDTLKSTVESLASRMIGLMIVSGIFIFLVGISATQSTKARDASEISGSKIEKLNSRVDVQEERMKWILEGIQRIESTLRKQKGNP